MRIVAVSGGTGSSKFLRGLQKLARFTVVANVGDNGWFHGLYVCPDIDTVTYTLAQVADEKRGWGVEGDTFRALAQLERLGSAETWFKIGDVDMATHIFRTAMLRDGRTLTQATAAVARALGLRSLAILPATDSHVETRIMTAEMGEMHLQQFWVREKGRLTPEGVRYAGARGARPTREVAASIESADRVIIAPANPITSVLPVLSIAGFRALLRRTRARRVAVSPMKGQGAFSGPAAKLMASRGLEPTSLGVARLYRGLVDVIVIDEEDRGQATAIEKEGISCVFTSTLMRSREDEVRLAKVAMEA